jgi:hypothetical protein
MIRKFKQFKSWLLWDAEGTYIPSLHRTRREAREDAKEHQYRDAKWRVIRVLIRRA